MAPLRGAKRRKKAAAEKKAAMAAAAAVEGAPGAGGRDWWDGFCMRMAVECENLFSCSGDDGRTKAVDVTGPGGAPLTGGSRPSGGDRGGGYGDGGYEGGGGGDYRGGGGGGHGCYKCGEEGHMARDCSQGGSGGVLLV